MWIADHSLAANQDERPHQAEKKKVSSGILVARRECDRLEAQATKIPFGDVGSLLKEALKACNDYRNSKLTTAEWGERIDRKSTRLNSSHLVISYAVFCLKKK